MKILIVVDMQSDFMLGGALPIERGRKIIPYINREIPKYDLVIATYDYHPPDHVSFKKYGKHCVQLTPGSSPVKGIRYNQAKSLLPWFKGFNPKADSTSAFRNELGFDTGLSDAILSFCADSPLTYINPTKIIITIVGVAAGICVKDTAMDADKMFIGYGGDIQVHAKGTACLSDESHEEALKEMEQAGITIVR